MWSEEREERGGGRMRSVKEVGYMIQEFCSCINGDALVRKEGGAGCRRRRE